MPRFSLILDEDGGILLLESGDSLLRGEASIIDAPTFATGAGKAAGMASKGAQEHKEEKPIRTNAGYYNRVYGRDTPDLLLAGQEFRFRLARKDFGDVVPIDGLVEMMEWRDEGTASTIAGANINIIPVLRGTATLRKPAPTDPLSKLTIRDGHVIRCDVKWGGNWKDVWEMRIQTGTISVADGAWSFDLADDLALASKSSYDYKFAKKGHKKKGYRYWEIVRAVCKEAQIELDHKMPKGERWIRDFEETQISPLEAVRRVVELEQEWSGKPMLITMRKGKLTIRHMRRNPALYKLAQQIRTADITTGRKARIWTSVTGFGSGKVKSQKSGKKITKHFEVSMSDKEAVKKFGFIHRDIHFGHGFEEEAEIKKLTEQKLKNGVTPYRIIANFTHYGIAFVRRGDTLKVKIPSEDIEGNHGILFVTSVVHTLSAGDYSMALDFTFTDPLDPNELRKLRDAAQRKQKRAEKGKDHASS